MDECKPLADGTSSYASSAYSGGAGSAGGRGLHSSTFRLNVSAFCGIGGAFRVFQGVLRRG